MWKKIIVLALIALLHFGASLMSWSLHPGNAAIQTSNVYSTIWTICSFPLMYLPYNIIDVAFMPLLFLNSCIWSITIFIIFNLIRKTPHTTKKNFVPTKGSGNSN